jgi:hypothetical protein
MDLMLSIVGVAAIGGLYVLFPVFLQTYRRLRGPRVVRCPETLQATVVELEPGRGAAGALLGRSTLRVRECARWQEWPAHRDCDQDCLKGVSVEDAEGHALLTPTGRASTS